jgi:hypothetical protein
MQPVTSVKQDSFGVLFFYSQQMMPQYRNQCPLHLAHLPDVVTLKRNTLNKSS